MNAVTRKAKAGVTLVELLVVILIVTILSVSLLPLLKPYIEESKYAAEPIPVLANLQTKIELYQYEKDKLPELTLTSVTNGTATWYYDSSKANTGTNAYIAVAVDKTSTTVTDSNKNPDGHIQFALDVDWQDFTGKRMRPNHFQYTVSDNTGPSKYCYAVAVVGDGTGLGIGTGYAVCKIVNAKIGEKVVATWKKYKATIETQYQLRVVDNLSSYSAGVIPVPASDNLESATTWKAMLEDMKAAGWEF